MCYQRQFVGVVVDFFAKLLFWILLENKTRIRMVFDRYRTSNGDKNQKIKEKEYRLKLFKFWAELGFN